MSEKLHFVRHLVINDPDAFLRENYNWCFRLCTDEMLEYMDDCHINTGTVEFDVDFDPATLIAKVVQAIDRQIDKEKEDYAARLEILDKRKKELLALPAPANPESEDSPGQIRVVSKSD
jgi:hypothetical protein